MADTNITQKIKTEIRARIQTLEDDIIFEDDENDIPLMARWKELKSLINWINANDPTVTF